jgi:hypothetical protein
MGVHYSWVSDTHFTPFFCAEHRSLYSPDYRRDCIDPLSLQSTHES